MPSLKKSLIVEQFQGNYLKKNLVANEWEHLKRKDRLEDFPHPP